MGGKEWRGRGRRSEGARREKKVREGGREGARENRVGGDNVRRTEEKGEKKRGDGGKLQTSGWSMAAGVKSSTMLVVTAMAVTSNSGALAVMLTKITAVCSLSESSCCMDA